MARTKFSVTLITYLSGLSGTTAYATVFTILLVCGLGVPIPEDITLVAAGILAALNKISFFGALCVGFLGVLAGDCILFFLGRRFGAQVFRLPLFRNIFTEKRINLARQKILSNSKLICFTARFLPGLRAPIYLTAGVMGVRPITFILLDGIAALISVPVWVYLGWLLGDNLDQALTTVLKTQKYIFLTIVVIILFYIWYRIRQKRRELKALDQSPQE